MVVVLVVIVMVEGGGGEGEGEGEGGGGRRRRAEAEVSRSAVMSGVYVCVQVMSRWPAHRRSCGRAGRVGGWR